MPRRKYNRKFSNINYVNAVNHTKISKTERKRKGGGEENEEEGEKSEGKSRGKGVFHTAE